MEVEESASLPTILLPPDILVQIFHKLPINSIHKCKLVCKEWSSLISDPFFKSNYNPSSVPNQPPILMMIPSPTSPNRNRHKNLLALSYEIDDDNRSNKPLVSRPQPLPSNFSSQDRVSVLGSWNGLVALYRHPGDFCLFNPYVPGKERVVHVPVDEDDVYLRTYNKLFGLCHDSVNDEYKAVLYNSRFFGPCGYVVSFKDGSWKLKGQCGLEMLGPWRSVISTSGTIVKGVPYWHCREGIYSTVFYFDLKTEEFRYVPVVPIEKEVWGLGALDGQLTASVKTDGGLEVWSLKELGNGDCCWSRVFVIANKLRSLSTLWWMVEGVEVLIDVNGEALMVYNVRDKSLRLFQRRMKRSLYNIVAYIPTLICPM